MSLYGAYDADNVFAKILRGEMPCVKVYETEAVLAFMDVFPQSEGHVLVVSKTSAARTILDIDADAFARVAETARRVARAAHAALKPDGITLMQFNGEAGGQTVFHLHMHVIPRWADRPMKGHGHAPMADMELLKATAARIAAAMDA